MKVLIYISLVLFFLGCNDTQTDTPMQTKAKADTTVMQESKPTGIKSTIAPVRIVTGKSLYMKCSGCHGIDASKSALGKSAVIKGWSVEKLTKALSGYKEGSYGREMKSVMQTQVKELNSVDIFILSEYISKL